MNYDVQCWRSTSLYAEFDYREPFDPAHDYGKGRWVKIDKPVFPPLADPLEEKAKEIAAELSDADYIQDDLIVAITETLR